MSSGMSSARARRRRHEHRKDVQAIVEILAKAARLDGGLQVIVRRRDDAHVRGDALVAAHALEGLLLQDAKQLHLHGERHVADLVEEQGSPFRHLEAPAPGADRAGERPLLVTEQLTLEELRGDGSAVDGHERLVTPAGAIVDVSRHHFLAGAGLAEDQHLRVGVGNLVYQLAHFPYARAAADEVSEQLDGPLLTVKMPMLTVRDDLLQRVGEVTLAQRKLDFCDHGGVET